MAISSPQTNAKNTMAALLMAAKNAGWVRVKGEIRPDGSISLDVGMVQLIETDSFLDVELRMGK